MNLFSFKVDLANWIRNLATRLDGHDPGGACVSYLHEMRAQVRQVEILSRLVNSLQEHNDRLECDLNEYNARLAEETRLRQEVERKLARVMR